MSAVTPKDGSAVDVVVCMLHGNDEKVSEIGCRNDERAADMGGGAVELTCRLILLVFCFFFPFIFLVVQLAFFQTTLAPYHAFVTPISQLRQHCNTAVITKVSRAMKRGKTGRAGC